MLVHSNVGTSSCKAEDSVTKDVINFNYAKVKPVCDQAETL